MFARASADALKKQMQSESFPFPLGVAEADVVGSGISVVIPAYNASTYLSATLQSVLNQIQQPNEVIVVDDGSTDDTPGIARSFGARIISLQNRGPSAARNAGTRAARFEYVAYLDADDLWTPEKLAVQHAALKSYGLPAFSFTDYRKFDERGVHKRSSELRHNRAFRRIATQKSASGDVIMASDGRRPLLYDSYIPPSSIVVRRADALEVGGFDETLRAAEDFEFCLRLFTLRPAVAVMRPLLLYRQHARQATANSAAMKRAFFEVAKRVAARPERYPSPDVDRLGRTEHERYYQLAKEEARGGLFDESMKSLERSLAAQWTWKSWLALFASGLCRTPGGRLAFGVVQKLWKMRPTRC
jgi:glycosyltransferase involved in cell wall biosynthesis